MGDRRLSLAYLLILLYFITLRNSHALLSPLPTHFDADDIRYIYMLRRVKARSIESEIEEGSGSA